MKQVTVRKKCPDCKKGEMKATGNGVSTGYNSTWKHKCDTCYTHPSNTLEVAGRAGVTFIVSSQSNTPELGVRFYDKAYPYEYFEFTKAEKKIKWEK